VTANCFWTEQNTYRAHYPCS